MGSPRIRIARHVLLAALATGALACGHADSHEEKALAAAPDPDQAAAAAQAEAGGSAGGGVPDACQAVPAAELASGLGAEGAGQAAGSGSRRVCIYGNGVIVGVSEASQYEGSVSLARGTATCEDVAGVGDRAAFCVTAGTAGQLMWVDGDLMYDVTAPQTDRAAFLALAAKVG